MTDRYSVAIRDITNLHSTSRDSSLALGVFLDAWPDVRSLLGVSSPALCATLDLIKTSEENCIHHELRSRTFSNLCIVEDV